MYIACVFVMHDVDAATYEKDAAALATGKYSELQLYILQAWCPWWLESKSIRILALVNYALNFY